MVRLRESNRKINPKRYYLWSYIPNLKKNEEITPTGKFLYQKKICGVPFYTTLHARRMMYYQLGLESFSEIHIIRGRKLIKQGITYLEDRKPNAIWFKGRLRYIKKWITPADYMLNKHRRRRFRVKMFTLLEKYGKKRFNQELIRIYYGYRPGTTAKHKNFNRFKAYLPIIPQVAKNLRIQPEDIVVTFRHGQSIYYSGSVDPFMEEGTPEYQAIHKKSQKDGKSRNMG